MNNFVKLTLGALCIICLYLWYTRDKLDLTIFTEDFPLTYVKVENGQNITVESGYNKSFCFLGDFDIAKINNLARKNPSFNLSIQRAFSESSIFNRQIPSKSKQLYEVFAPSGMKDGLYFVFLCDSSKANLGLCNPKELETEDFDVLASSAFSKKIGSGGVDGPSFPHNRTCGFPASGCSTPSLLSRENRKLIDCVFQFWSKEREMA